MTPQILGMGWRCCPYSIDDELLTTLVLKIVPMVGVKKMMFLLAVRLTARPDGWFHCVSLLLGVAPSDQKQVRLA
jgi:hypothetical protein